MLVGAVVVLMLMSALASLRDESSGELQSSCLTSADLNRSDLANVVIFSRFCEGLGLSSSIYWQRDEANHVYGLPVCVARSDVNET